jgi:hypothetical protein
MARSVAVILLATVRVLLDASLDYAGLGRIRKNVFSETAG